METVKRSSIQQFAQAHPRLLCCLLVLLGIAITLYEWHAIRHGHFYNPVAAVLGPLCAVFFAGLALVPTGARKTLESQERARRVLATVAVIGVIAGLLNWYAMTH